MKKLLALGALALSLTLAGCVNLNPTEEEVAEPVAEEVVTPEVVEPVAEEEAMPTEEEAMAEEVVAEEEAMPTEEEVMPTEELPVE